MGIPMWREPSEADAPKTALEKDPTAAARSSIRRANAIRHPLSQTADRTRRLLSTFHSQVLEEIQRGNGESQPGVRSPVLNLGVSEDGLDLDASRRQALSRGGTRPDSQRRSETASRRSQGAREFQDYLAARADTRSRNSTRAQLTPGFAPAVAYRTSTPPHLSSDDIHLPPVSLPSSSGATARRGRYDERPSSSLRQFFRGVVSGALPHESPVDGLGDRQRSLSPDAERENDAWETLLSTIAPDANSPSTDTSFPSNNPAQRYRRNASALASAILPQNSTSTRARQLALDPYPSNLHPCDFSSDEDDQDTPAHHRRLGGTLGTPPVVRRRSPGVHSTMSSHPPVPTIALTIPEGDPNDPHLIRLRAELDRLAREPPGPGDFQIAAAFDSDDWWIEAANLFDMNRRLNGSRVRTENERNE